MRLPVHGLSHCLPVLGLLLAACSGGANSADKRLGGGQEPAAVIDQTAKTDLPKVDEPVVVEAKAPSAAEQHVDVTGFLPAGESAQIGGVNLRLADAPAPAAVLITKYVFDDATGDVSEVPVGEAAADALGRVAIAVAPETYVKLVWTRADGKAFAVIVPFAATHAFATGSASLALSVTFNDEATVAADLVDFVLHFTGKFPAVLAIARSGMLPLMDALRLAATKPSGAELKVLRLEFFKAVRSYADALVGRELGDLVTTLDPGGVLSVFGTAETADAMARGKFDLLDTSLRFAQKEHATFAALSDKLLPPAELTFTSAVLNKDTADQLQNVLITGLSQLLKIYGVSGADIERGVEVMLASAGTTKAAAPFTKTLPPPPPVISVAAPGAPLPPPLAPTVTLDALFEPPTTTVAADAARTNDTVVLDADITKFATVAPPPPAVLAPDYTPPPPVPDLTPADLPAAAPTDGSQPGTPTPDTSPPVPAAPSPL